MWHGAAGGRPAIPKQAPVPLIAECALLCNIASLERFRYHVTRAWHKWLSRRSNRARMPWERFSELEQRYPLPAARLRCIRLIT